MRGFPLIAEHKRNGTPVLYPVETGSNYFHFISYSFVLLMEHKAIIFGVYASAFVSVCPSISPFIIVFHRFLLSDFHHISRICSLIECSPKVRIYIAMFYYAFFPGFE